MPRAGLSSFRAGCSRRYRLDRQESNDRVIRYTLVPYANEKPHGDRYAEGAYGDYHGN